VRHGSLCMTNMADKPPQHGGVQAHAVHACHEKVFTEVSLLHGRGMNV
jgi:hypothetical protein